MCICVSLGFIKLVIYMLLAVAKFCGYRNIVYGHVSVTFYYFSLALMFLGLFNIYKTHLLYRRMKYGVRIIVQSRRCHCVYIRFPWVLKGSESKSLIALNVNMLCLSSEQTNKIYLRYYVI